MTQAQWDNALRAQVPIALPEGFAASWQARREEAAALGTTRRIPVEPGNPLAIYEQVEFSATDGRRLSARVIRPITNEAAPLVLMFHDSNRPVRGWHHMTRFIALGYGVFALENRDDATTSPAQRITDALSAAQAALCFAASGAHKLYTWGEGLGGTLALAAAALFKGQIDKCAVLNPLCAGDYQACVHFASLLECPLLMGTSGMDEIAPWQEQCAVYGAVSAPKRHFLYPKYIHERINAFEDRLLVFLHPSTVV